MSRRVRDVLLLPLAHSWSLVRCSSSCPTRSRMRSSSFRSPLLTVASWSVSRVAATRGPADLTGSGSTWSVVGPSQAITSSPARRGYAGLDDGVYAAARGTNLRSLPVRGCRSSSSTTRRLTRASEAGICRRWPAGAPVGGVGPADEAVAQLVADQRLGEVVEVREEHRCRRASGSDGTIVSLDELDDAPVAVEREHALAGRARAHQSLGARERVGDGSAKARAAA